MDGLALPLPLPEMFSLLSVTFRTTLAGLVLALGEIEDATPRALGVDWLLELGVIGTFGDTFPLGVVAPRGVKVPRGLLFPRGVEIEGDLELSVLSLGDVL